MNLAVVMPTVHRGFYTDQKDGYDYFTFVGEELPAICERFFRCRIGGRTASPQVCPWAAMAR